MAALPSNRFKALTEEYRTKLNRQTSLSRPRQNNIRIVNEGQQTNAHKQRGQVISLGEALSRSKRWSPLVESIKDKEKRTLTSVILENTKSQWMDTLNETTRTLQIGTFDKYAFPLIRVIFPNLVATELVSVQPMTGPTSVIFYFDFVYGTSKGQITAGQKLVGSATTPGPFDSTYTSETISDETIAPQTNLNIAITGNLSYFPVRPGTVVFNDGGTQFIRDDGNGALVGNLGSGGTASINYSNGAYSFSWAGNSTGIVNATYQYDSESVGSADLIPQIDILISSSPVVAKTRKLRARWSLESANNMRALYGTDAETELVTAIAEEIKFELDREVIEDLYAIAYSQVPDFDQTPPSSTTISFTEHKLHLVDRFIEGNNQIFSATRRATANWMVAGVNVCNIIETLPGFKALPENTSMGVRHIGNLMGRWEVYKDPFTVAGVDNSNRYLMGYRGASFLDTGYVYAPYIPLYATPSIALDDFVVRKGLATQYAKKVINPKFYALGTISGTTGGY